MTDRFSTDTHKTQAGAVDDAAHPMATVPPAPKIGNYGQVLFDRLNPEPPPYLYQLRTVGHWRRWKHKGTYRKISTALRNTGCDYLPTDQCLLPIDRGCFLDAGCGHSSDAFFAMKRWGFKRGIKVDLFPPYETIPEFRTKMEQFENHRTRFVQGDICKLTDFIASGSVDMIGCAAVLDLMDRADRALFYGEAYEVLRPGGVMTVTYQWLTHGYHDWGDGDADLANAIDVGFESLNCHRETLIVKKPSAPENPSRLRRKASFAAQTPLLGADRAQNRQFGGTRGGS